MAQSLLGVDPHAALAHQVDLLIEDRLGQPVFRDAVAQPATRFGHRLEQIDLEPLVTQIITAGETARAAADNGHPLALGRLLCRLIGGNLGQIEIGGMALELTNGQRLIHQRTAALRFTKSGANPADGERHRQGLLDDGHCRLVLPHGDVVQIGLNVHPGRTGALAGGFAIGVVICEDAAERLLAVGAQVLAFGRDHHPCLGARLAGAADAETGNLYHAEIAGCFGAAGVVTAQGGDVDLVLFGYLEQGFGRVNRQLSPIEGDGDHGVINSLSRRRKCCIWRSQQGKRQGGRLLYAHHNKDYLQLYLILDSLLFKRENDFRLSCLPHRHGASLRIIPVKAGDSLSYCQFMRLVEERLLSLVVDVIRQ